MFPLTLMVSLATIAYCSVSANKQLAKILPPAKRIGSELARCCRFELPPLLVLAVLCHGQCICHCVSNSLSLFSWPSKSNTFIFLFIFGLEVIHHIPERSINYSSEGRREREKDFERQIHLDLIGKHVGGLQMPNTFLLRCG